MSSYYERPQHDEKVRESEEIESWEHEGGRALGQVERTCRRCHGLGEDKDGADCVHCEGNGSVYV